MRKMSGCFNGTGIATFFCLGFIPDQFRIQNMEIATSDLVLEWTSQMRDGANCWGNVITRHLTGGNIIAAKNAVTAGVTPYEGGDLITTTNQASVAYGGPGAFLGIDNKDYAKDPVLGYVTAPIDTWTMDTAANRTGHVNSTIPATTAIGEGSSIVIREASTGLIKKAIVVAWAASAGTAANAVTLSRNIGSGQVLRISGMYSLTPLPYGDIAPAGLLLQINIVNPLNDFCCFEAEEHDTPLD